MRSAIIGLLAETSLHPGAEQSTGVVDLPVARESSTGYPVIVGSSLKGALKDMVRQRQKDSGTNNIEKEIFGEQNNSGVVAVTDARLLLLPIRSLTGHFKLVTCPYLLDRFKRDMELAGLECSFSVPPVWNGQALMLPVATEQLFLEELSFEVEACEGQLPPIIDAIRRLIRHNSVQARLEEQLVLVSNDDFKYFASYGLQVNARNELNNETKTSKNLWYEETIPADSVFYGILMERSGRKELLDYVKSFFKERPYIQVGGNETIGQGWCTVAWVEKG